jgi:hypothetical protein
VSRAPSMRQAWRRPVQLAWLTGIGLGLALVGTGPWHWLAWACLTVPIVAAVRSLLRAGR